MASITLPGLLLHDADDPADEIHLDALTALTATVQTDGEVRTYAGGRRLLRRRPGQARSHDVTVRLERRAGLAWLHAHVGHVVLARDFAGNVVWGVYFTVPAAEVAAETPLVDVTLQIESVSRTAEV